MGGLPDYSNPDFLTFDSNATQALWEAGDTALSVMWGSRGGAILDDEGSDAAIVSSTVLAAAPTFGGNATPATTLWWDGFTIAKNISDEDAAASFQAMMVGLGSDVVEANRDAAVWLHPAYQPSPASAGVVASAQAGARPYPMVKYVGVMHTALLSMSKPLQSCAKPHRWASGTVWAHISGAGIWPPAKWQRRGAVPLGWPALAPN